MANMSALPRNSAGLRSPNDFDGIIERIDNLRLSCEIGQKIGSVDRDEPTDLRKKWNIALENEKGDDCGNRDEDDSGNDNDSGDGNEEDEAEDTNRTDRLIARGPMKSQFLPKPRDRPYDWTYNVQPSLHAPRTNETHFLDYEETAVQILRDKESRERLNECLDQLQAHARSMLDHLNEDEIEESSRVQDANADFCSDSACDENDDAELLEKLLRGDFQSAQYCSSNDSPPTTTIGIATLRHDSPAISSSESRDSTYVSCDECPWMQKRSNHLHSPLGSPEIVAAATCYEPPRLSLDLQNSCSLSPSSSASSFSPSSNQSYGEAYSPNGFRMINGILESRIEETLGEDLDNFSFWTDGFKLREENGNRPDIAKSVENTRKCDTIDNNELQLVEEVLRDLGEERRCEPEERQPPRRAISSEKIADVSLNANSIRYRTDSEASRLSYEAIRKRDPVPEYRTPDDIDDSITRTDYQVDAIVPKYATENSDATTCYHNGTTKPEFFTFPRSFVTNSSVARLVVNDANGANSINNVNNVNNMNNTNNVNGVNGIEAQLVFSEPQRKRSVGEFHMAEFTNDRYDLEIPKTVACFESAESFRTTRNSDRNITPWPLLKLPSVKASERLKDAVDPKEVERAMRCLLKWSPADIAKQDRDGYTRLMCLVGNPEEIAKKSAYLAPLVERTPRDVLSCTNDRGEDALYLAALNCPQYSYVAGYLAATMLQRGIDVSQQLYNTRGNTLVHLVAGQGDTHAEIMAELLALRTIQGNRVFDLSTRNYDGKTALHVAIESHEPLTKGISTVATVKLLLECGADPRIKERKRGDSALHMAVSLTSDPALVKVLLEKHVVDLVNTVNYNHDTPLHAAATVSNNVPVERQRELFRLLVQAGGHTNLSNRQGKVPLALVTPERKSVIKKIIYKRS